MKLTDKACKTAKAKEKPYKLADGGGLYLEVMPTGSKCWRMKYRIFGKEKRLAIGVYPLVSLADARQSREMAKKLLSQQVDPSDAKRDGRREAQRNADNTFKAVALEWHEVKKGGGWSDKHTANVLRRLELDIFPYLGNRPISAITAPDVLDARTTIREQLDYDPDVIEAQLAHKAAGPLGEAYNRAQHLTKRKRMMQEWADYIDTLASGGKVIRGKFSKAA